jgi:hypothetical protein
MCTVTAGRDTLPAAALIRIQAIEASRSARSVTASTWWWFGGGNVPETRRNMEAYPDNPTIR